MRRYHFKKFVALLSSIKKTNKQQKKYLEWQTLTIFLLTELHVNLRWSLLLKFRVLLLSLLNVIGTFLLNLVQPLYFLTGDKKEITADPG